MSTSTTRGSGARPVCPEGTQAQEARGGGGGAGPQGRERRRAGEEGPGQQGARPESAGPASLPVPAYEMGQRGCTRLSAGPLLPQTHPTLYSSPIKPFRHPQDQGQVESKRRLVF